MAQRLEDESWKGAYEKALDELNIDLSNFWDFVPEPDPKTLPYQWRKIDPNFKKWIENSSRNPGSMVAEDLLLTNEPLEDLKLKGNALSKAAQNVPLVLYPRGSIYPTTRFGQIQILIMSYEYRTNGGLEVFQRGLIVTRSKEYYDRLFGVHMEKIVVNANFYLGEDRSIPLYPFKECGR